jgi:hypothetical protein
MLRIIWFSLLIILPLNSTKTQIISHWGEDSSYYLYRSINENLIPQKITFDQNLSKKEVLDSIANYLTVIFFVTGNEYHKDKRKIVVTVPKVISIEVHNRIFYIASININDPDKVCMTTFFQGSTGAYNTYLTLMSNFIQPQLVVPLLDGIVFSYNDEELKVMDHINLEGLISEREIDYYIRTALKK